MVFEVQFPEIGSSLTSLEMIFEALQSELFRFKFHTMSGKTLKIPEFNLGIKFIVRTTGMLQAVKHTASAARDIRF